MVVQRHLGWDFFLIYLNRSIPQSSFCLLWHSAADQRQSRPNSRAFPSLSLMSFQGHICFATTVSAEILAPADLTTGVCCL